ncbi:MAG: glutamate dehydrogenase [Streptosporangiales bacterium]|nr:glutamate dehydrogenase [Streptosporangiales bacterium]
MPAKTARRPYLRVIWSDPESDATGYLVVDRLVTGIGTGGLRTRAGCTLEEVEDLAREMSLKVGAYGVPVGGAKGGIDYPPDAPDVDEVRLRYVQAMRPYLDSMWTTAADFGTPQASLDQVFERAGLGSSSLRAGLRRSPDPEATAADVKRQFVDGEEGLTMPALIGGYGVAEAGLAGLEGLGIAPAEATAVVQGFGAMGGSTALYLAKAGVRVVGISDAQGLLVNTERGLDVPALLAARSPAGAIDRAVLRSDDTELPGSAWLDLDVDLLVPAAVSYTITTQNCAQVKARLIAEAANVPITPDAERSLTDRGVVVVPDFVANAGAAVWAWWVVLGLVTGPADSRSLLSKHVRPLVGQLIDAWRENSTPPREAAARIAEENLARNVERYGGVVERVPLFEAGAQAAGLTRS